MVLVLSIFLVRSDISLKNDSSSSKDCCNFLIFKFTPIPKFTLSTKSSCIALSVDMSDTCAIFKASLEESPP